MLWRVLDAVKELLEVVVPHLNNQHLSQTPKMLALSEPCCLGRPLSLDDLLEDLSLDDLLQLQDDRACPAAVLLPLESRDRSRTSAELASKRPSLPPASLMGGLT